MSSVLVKGMAMPKDCRECPLQEYYWGSGNTLCFPADKYLAEKYNPIGFEGRANFCPLVEVKTPHGRLFDETEVKKCLQELTDCEDKWSAIALLEWAIEKRLCIEAEDKT